MSYCWIDTRHITVKIFKIENIEEILLANQTKPDIRAFLPRLDFLRMSCIYASIFGLLEIPSCWFVDELKRT